VLPQGDMRGRREGTYAHLKRYKCRLRQNLYDANVVLEEHKYPEGHDHGSHWELHPGYLILKLGIDLMVGRQRHIQLATVRRRGPFSDSNPRLLHEAVRWS